MHRPLLDGGEGPDILCVYCLDFERNSEDGHTELPESEYGHAGSNRTSKDRKKIRGGRVCRGKLSKVLERLGHSEPGEVRNRPCLERDNLKLSDDLPI
jgi:hypothetical protein